MNMTSRTERFQRKGRDKEDEKPEEPEEVIRFSAEEEAVRVPPIKFRKRPLMCKQALVEESNAVKKEANDLFVQSLFRDAITTYDKALATCPNYLEYEIAVLKSNVAACYLKLEDWKEAVKAASAALDGLDKLQGRDNDGEKKVEEGVKGPDEEEADEEIISEGATKAEDTSDKGKREADIERIRGKALMRRARARSELGGWANLQGAEEGMFLPCECVFSGYG